MNRVEEKRIASMATDALQGEVRVHRALGRGVYHCRSSGGSEMVCKSGPHAAVEGAMLTYLADYLPCAACYHVDESLLIMEYIRSSGPVDEERTARFLAQMHRKPFGYFGFEYDTTIGPHAQVNTPHASWIGFFRECRIMPMAEACYREGRIDLALLRRLEACAERLDRHLDEPRHPSLLHGDVWGGNVLSREGEPVFIDPAVYYGHHEMELAFIRLFHTFSARFFDAYREVMPIREGFDERVPLWNLYPLLVHVRSFGGSYLQDLQRGLRTYGY